MYAIYKWAYYLTQHKCLLLAARHLTFFFCLRVITSCPLLLSQSSLFPSHPPAYHALICHIYNGNIQIYRCYQLITSALITIQLTSVSMRHATGRPAPSALNHIVHTGFPPLKTRLRLNGRNTESEAGIDALCRHYVFSSLPTFWIHRFDLLFFTLPDNFWMKGNTPFWHYLCSRIILTYIAKEKWKQKSRSRNSGRGGEMRIGYVTDASMEDHRCDSSRDKRRKLSGGRETDRESEGRMKSRCCCCQEDWREENGCVHYRQDCSPAAVGHQAVTENHLCKTV